MAARAETSQRAQPVAASPMPVNEWAETYPVQVLPPPTPRKPIDAGAVLLGLGALFILVAASIISALALGVLALPLMTVLAAGLTWGADRKKLKTTTETLLAITALLGGLTTGLFLWDNPGEFALWGLIGLATSFGFSEATRGHRDYFMPKFLAASYLFPITAGIYVATVDDSLSVLLAFAAAVVCTVVCGLIAGLFRYRAMGFAWKVAALGAGFWLVVSGAAGWYGAILHSEPKRFFGEAYFLPLLILGIAAGAGFLALKMLPPVARLVLAVFGFTHLFFLIYLPLITSHPRVGVAFGLLWALACAIPATTRDTHLAARIASVWGLVFGLGPVLALVALLADDLRDSLDAVIDPSWHEALLAPSDQRYTALASLLLFACYLGATLRWPLLRSRALQASSMVRAAILLIIPFLILFNGPSLLTLSGSLVIAAVAYWTLEHKTQWYSVALLALAPSFALLHDAFGAAALLTCGLLALAMRLWGSPASYLARCNEFVFAVFLIAAPILALVAKDASSLTICWLGVVAALLALAGYYLCSTRKLSMPGLEAGAFLMGLALYSISLAENSAAESALLFTAGGAVVAGLGLAGQRKIYKWLAGLLVGTAWVLRLSASDVTTPEAYTAPFAVALLALGAYYLWKRPGLSSLPQLSPGLSLALLPSAPWILADPTSLRALLVGGVAFAFLVVGARLSIKALFLAGAFFLTFLALIELGPYVLLMSRWLILGAVGITCAVIGATWESRVNDGRTVVKYLHVMR